MSFSPSKFEKYILLRLMTVLAVVLAFLLIVPSAFAYETEEITFLNLINNYRQSIGVRTLQMNQKLFNASEAHSTDMGVNSYFAHNSLDGRTPWDRIRAAGYTFNTSLGENLAAGYQTAQAAFDAWKASPGHDTNMRNGTYCAVGVSRVYVPNSVYGYYWTTDFGGVCENDPQPTLDVTPPSVAIPYPTGSSIVSGIVVFSANASDNVGVNRVDLLVDGQVVGTDTSAPYNYVWDVRGLSGSHTLRATAYDDAGNQSQATLNVTVNNFSPTEKYYFTWYDQSNANWRDWVLMANPSTGQTTARTSAVVGTITYADRNIAIGAPAETPQFPGVMGGPVTVGSTQPLIASQRVLYKDSFNEIAGIPADQLETTYYFSWYDAEAANGMQGDWILVGNQGNATATVQIYIAGALRGSYEVPAGGQITPSYPGTTNGPVKVISTNNQPLIVSQRVLYRNSFNEVLGIPASKLASEYNFTWYDAKPENDMGSNWILIGNMDTGSASVDVYIGGNKMASYTIPEGQRIAPQYPGVMDGPVKVTSTNGKKLLVSQRILFRDSFEEFQGLVNQDFGTDLWFTWYDSMLAHGMGGNWILIANRGVSQANVNVYVGGTLREQLSLPVGANTPLSFENTAAGPVRIVSTNGVPLLATQRVIYLDSFNEIGGTELQ
jgi:hypothetical protein